ncbi:NLR family CARD domain-containing 3-like, partial [Paramuricea clavata]
MQKLNEFTIGIHTVEIQSTCKLEQVLVNYSLPPCLEVLRISDNTLDEEDIFALIRSLRNMKGLHELDLCCTRFTESSFNCFITVLIKCSDLRRLCLTDNGLTKQDVNYLITAFESLKNLKNLNLSKNNVTETQANDILQKYGEGNSIVSLDLSQNALQGNEIIVRICKLDSLEEVNLSHNHIRFHPLPSLEEGSNKFPINTKIISLSSNHMIPNDICRFLSLIRSDLLKLNLDFNHVGNSIWSLCSLRIFKHLKVLSLASTDICGPAVDGLAILLSSVTELEELNLSSNNLMLEDFRNLQSHLSNLTRLKKLNLSNNNLDGITVILQEILPSLNYLEELRLSNVRLNGDDCNKIYESLKFLRSLKYFDLSINAIGPDGTRALANILKEIPLLEGLDVSKSCIKEYAIDLFCKALVPLNKLRHLNLSGNRIDIEILDDALSLPPNLQELILSDIIHGGKLFVNMIPLQHQLRILHLSKIKLRLCDADRLAAMLSSFRLLQELVLTNVDVADRKCEKIFSAIKLLKNLKKLDLGGMKVNNGKAFIEIFSSLLFLKEIVFPDVLIHDDGVIGCFDALRSLTYLKNLHLGRSTITQTGAVTLANVLPSLQLLEKLVLKKIEFDDECQKHLFHAVGKLKYLKELDLGWSKTTHTGAVTLAEVLPSLQLLEKLVLKKIEFDDECQKHLFHAVGKLKYLKKLDLGWSKITQTGAVTLAEVLPSLQLLEKLVLRDIKFDDEHQKHLFHAVGKLKYLKKLVLRFSKITQTGAVTLAEVLPSLQLLEKLLLEGIIEVDDECQKHLFHAVGKLKYLKKLDLGWSKITQTGAVTLAEVLPSLQLLEKLVLRDIKFDDEHQKHLFHAVGKLKYLKKLVLRFSKITQTGAVTLAEVLPSLQLLEKLLLEGIIEVDDECQKHLFHAVGKLKYLKKLDLGWSKITQTGAVTLAEVLPSLQLLEKLVLQDIEFDDECQKHLFHAVGKLKYLKELDFWYTTITQTGAVILAEVLPSLQLLEKLVLQDIEVDDECQKHLFHAVGKLKYLKKLYFWYSTITQTGAVTLAEVLPSLQLLEKLVLQDIEFDDECQKHLFHAVGKLKYLKELYFWYSTITQTGAVTLAEVLPSLQLLEKLVLNVIEFDDECQKHLFHAVGKLKYLKELDLRWSKITQTGAVTLAEVLPSLQLLEKLVLKKIEFDDECQKHLFHGVRKLKYLNELDFALSEITQTGAVTLAEVLPSLQLLEKLVLKNIEFDDECQKHLFHAVGKLKYLNELDFGLSEITLAGVAALTDVLPSLCNLRWIFLSKIKSDETEISSNEESEENESVEIKTAKSKLEVAARLVPGLQI